MKKTIAALIVVAGLPFGASAEPSGFCESGFVPPNTTATGAGVRILTEPREATVVACNAGPAARGSVRADIDGNGRQATVVYDGDSTNRILACTDGYLGAGASVDKGLLLYQNKDGGFTSRARVKTPMELATDVTKDCAGVPPAA